MQIKKILIEVKEIFFYHIFLNSNLNLEQLKNLNIFINNAICEVEK